MKLMKLKAAWTKQEWILVTYEPGGTGDPLKILRETMKCPLSFTKFPLFLYESITLEAPGPPCWEAFYVPVCWRNRASLCALRSCSQCDVSMSENAGKQGLLEQVYNLFELDVLLSKPTSLRLYSKKQLVFRCWPLHFLTAGLQTAI